MIYVCMETQKFIFCPFKVQWDEFREPFHNDFWGESIPSDLEPAQCIKYVDPCFSVVSFLYVCLPFAEPCLMRKVLFLLILLGEFWVKSIWPFVVCVFSCFFVF